VIAPQSLSRWQTGWELLTRRFPSGDCALRRHRFQITRNQRSKLRFLRAPVVSVELRSRIHAYNGTVYDAATSGDVIAVDQQTEKAYWRINQGSLTLGSPVTIDHQLVLGGCNGGCMTMTSPSGRDRQSSSGRSSSTVA
jgi:hypothetical protein